MSLLSDDHVPFLRHHATQYAIWYQDTSPEDAANYAEWYVNKFGRRALSDCPSHSQVWWDWKLEAQ
jgi:hypothetical protein